MPSENLLYGKKILVVDDEPDVLQTLVALLPMCKITTASTFDEAKELLENQDLDMAIFDIMGVDGYSLLKIATEKKVTAIMLTAHALSPENIRKSREGGAASYLPKDKMADIATFLNDVLEAQKKGKNPWWRWLDRLSSYFDREFGTDWRIDDR
jgi:DNA-binding response OmpR family regulator